MFKSGQTLLKEDLTCRFDHIFWGCQMTYARDMILTILGYWPLMLTTHFEVKKRFLRATVCLGFHFSQVIINLSTHYEVSNKPNQYARAHTRTQASTYAHTDTEPKTWRLHICSAKCKRGSIKVSLDFKMWMQDILKLIFIYIHLLSMQVIYMYKFAYPNG